MKTPLSQELFDRLLAALSADRAAAGVLYEQLRGRLVRFFHWEGCVHAEDLADEVLNRAAVRIASGAFPLQFSWQTGTVAR